MHADAGEAVRRLLLGAVGIDSLLQLTIPWIAQARGTLTLLAAAPVVRLACAGVCRSEDRQCGKHDPTRDRRSDLYSVEHAKGLQQGMDKRFHGKTRLVVA